MSKIKGYVYLVLTLVIWGSLYVFSKTAMEELPPMALYAVRCTIAVIILFFVMKKRGFKRVKKKDRKVFFGIGFVGYFLGLSMQTIGNNLVDASLSSLINSLTPVVIPIIAVLFLNERVTFKICISIALSVIGTYIILGVGGNSGFWGILINILALVFWSSGSCMVRSIANDYDPIQITLYAMAISLCFALPVGTYSIIREGCSLSFGGAVSVVYLALVCTALAHVLWNGALKILPATTCSLFYPLQPLTSAILAVSVLGEKITVSFAVGAVIICAGMLTAVIDSKKE